jgi:DNA invertase Pin-like site-specific DNA recombinase
MEAARRGDILLVYRMDRLARNVYLGELLANEASKKRIELRAVEGSSVVGADETPEDRLIRQVLQAMAEYERRVIAARTKAAMLRHQRNGRRMGSVPPFGWKTDPDDPKRLVIDEDEQLAMTRVHELRKQGLSLNQIAREMEEGSHATRSRRSRQLVSRVLKREPAI